MNNIRSLSRDIVVVILGISSVLSHASGKAPKPQDSPVSGALGVTAGVAGQSQTVLPDGSQLQIGGIGPAGVTKSCFISKPQPGSHNQTSISLLNARAFHSATLLPNGSVLIFGGVGRDNAVVASAELFDPQAQAFKAIAAAGLTPRAHHTATLLTDDRVLIAGGIDSQGKTLSRIELWDSRTGQVSTLGVTLNTPRSGQTATLQPDGTVLLWGGVDANGNALNDGEIIDPNGPTIRYVSRSAGDSTQPTTPYLAASIPQNGEASVVTDQRISLRFSKPLPVAAINTSTVTLRSSAADVAIDVIPAEGGSLAFITPKTPLDVDTTYTLSISGVADNAGKVMPDTTILFTTTPTMGPTTPVGTGNNEMVASLTPSTTQNVSSAGSGGMPTDPRQLRPLKGPDGLTSLAGQVLTLDKSPLPNVRIVLDHQSAMTDNTGRFLVQNVGSGHHVMIVDGATANTAMASYGIFRVGVDLKAGRTNSLNYTVWMTPIDIQHEVTIPSPTTEDTVISNPAVPGLEVHIPAGTVIRDARGKVVTRLGITAIPVNQPPFPLKSGVEYPVYFTIQPSGLTFETQNGASLRSIVNRGGRGITVHYQNYMNAAPGSRFPFWSYDPEQKGWYIYGHGRVGADAKDVAPEEGTQLWSFDGAMVSDPTNAGNPAPKPSNDPGPAPQPSNNPTPNDPNPNKADPVDLQTGLFVYRRTDLTLNDVIPLILKRVYRPNDSLSRAFGIGTNIAFDDFMTGDNNTSPEGYTYQDFNLEDGSKIHFTRTSPCLGPNGYCDFSNALYEATSAPGTFYGATLEYVISGGNALGISTGDYWRLTTKGGTVYLFPDSDASTNPRAAAMQAMYDRNGNALIFTRDSNTFNLLQVSSPNGRWIQFTYDSSNRITQAQDSAGRTTSYTYNAAGYLATATDANGGTTTYTYDNNGNMVSVQDPRGIVYIQNQYDSNGMITQQNEADGGIFTFAYTVDSYGNVTQTTVTDPRGYIEQVTFDADGFMTSDAHAVGKPEQQTITYNKQPGTGLLLSVTDGLNRTTSYTYDAMGNVTSTTILAGTSGAATTTYAYDERHYELSTVTDPLGNVKSMTYDDSGNLIAATDPLGNTTNFSYNSAGEPITVTDPLGNQTQFSYNDGMPVSVSDPLGRTSTSSFDGAGRIVSASDPLGDTTITAYDALDEVTSISDPMGNQTQFTYDGNGNRLTVTDANQHTTTYTYDNEDRVSTRTDPLGHAEGFQYDLNGNLAKFTDRKGQVTTFSYDGLNRPTSEQFNDGSAVANTYDAGNRLTAIADSLSGTISRSYDGFNDLLSETTPQGSLSYTYDADRRRQTMTVSGQSQINYAFDNDSRLTSITQGSAAVGFSYDADNRRASLTLPNGITATYSYDQASQLTGIVYQGGALAPANLEYTYDLAGRRTSVSGSLASEQLPAAVSSATYNADNQLTQWGSTTMSYDLNGNTLNDGTNSYVWDARNRLVSANSGGAMFAYDPLGRRISKTLLSTTTGFLYDDMSPVQEQNGSTVTANLLTGGVDERFQRTDATGTFSYLTDTLGSTLALTDTSGNSAVQYSYGPYGMLSITGSTTNSYDYTGRESDGLGIYYYRARYYNPLLGRFISEDPIGMTGGINEYVYVDDDPINYNDPFGLDKNSPQNCLSQAFTNNRAALIYDAASLGLDLADFIFPEGGELTKLVLSAGISTGSFINSLQTNDAAGAVSTVVGAQTTLVGWSAKSMGASWAHYVPYVNDALDVISAGKDLIQTYEDYESCVNP